jgi:hypothetical protein
MKVARHEMPGKRIDPIRPVGNGGIRGFVPYLLPKIIERPRQPIIPYPPGRAPDAVSSRHFMPGYLHLVPPGQKLFSISFVHLKAFGT